MQRLALGFTLGFLPAMAGCGPSQESLHELDHVTPAHWPVDMADAASKIQERLAIVRSDPSNEIASEEMRDLVDWVPEIAADTNLSEEQWIPIQALSETLGRHLMSKDIKMSDVEDDFLRLSELLVAANSQLASEGLGKSD